MSQQRRDAIADAETLRLFLTEGRLFFDMGLTDIPAPLFFLANNKTPCHSVRRAIDAGHLNVAHRRTVRLVRAVRRAIPGYAEASGAGEGIR